jgi:hypothetical protein
MLHQATRQPRHLQQGRSNEEPAALAHAPRMRLRSRMRAPRMTDRSAWRELDPELNVRLAELADEGREIWHRFDREVRAHAFHPFVPADYDAVLDELLALRAPGKRFLEWGSAIGTITIMADLLGFEAYGIESDASLVAIARDLARRYDSAATFAVGSVLPTGYVYRAPDGDTRTGTLVDAPSGYLELGLALDDFDLVYGYAWPGEAPLMKDLMQRYGGADARLLLHEEKLRTWGEPSRRGRRWG